MQSATIMNWFSVCFDIDKLYGYTIYLYIKSFETQDVVFDAK